MTDQANNVCLVSHPGRDEGSPGRADAGQLRGDPSGFALRIHRKILL